MSFQALLAVGIIYFNVEAASAPGTDEEPVRWCAFIKGLEVTLYRLADARGDIKEIAVPRSVCCGW